MPISEELRKELDTQLSCVTHLLPMHFFKKEGFSKANIIKTFVNMVRLDEKEREYILEGTENVALRWEWGEEHDNPEDFVFHKNIHEEKQAFEDFSKCDKLSKMVKNKEKGESSSRHGEKINVQQLLAYFKPDQLYITKMPKFHMQHLVLNGENKEHAEILNKDCPICLQNFEPNDDVKSYRCTHIFHTNCIEHWLVSNISCPVCRAEIGYVLPAVQPQSQPENLEDHSLQNTSNLPQMMEA